MGLEKTCPSCSSRNDARSLFCTHCGSKLAANGAPNPRLRIVYGSPEGAVFVIRKGRNTLGHDSANTIVLGDDQISNKHAILFYQSDFCWIEDRQSKNGVYVDGVRISGKVAVDDGTVIKLGKTVLKFELPAV